MAVATAETCSHVIHLRWTVSQKKQIKQEKFLYNQFPFFEILTDKRKKAEQYILVKEPSSSELELKVIN
jgi:hypothetical protein